MKKNSTTSAQTLFHGVQWSGSVEDDEGIGKRSVRPSEVMRKILPGRREDASYSRERLEGKVSLAKPRLAPIL